MRKITPVIGLLVMLLTACGYHPRGALELPSGMKNIYLLGASAELKELFKTTMEASAIPMANSPESAGLVIKILNEDVQRRVLSLSSGGTANDFELEYRFDYQLVDANDQALSTLQAIQIKREYYNNQAAVIAKDNEEKVIRNEMYQQAVRMLVNRASMALQAPR